MKKLFLSALLTIMLIGSLVTYNFAASDYAVCPRCTNNGTGTYCSRISCYPSYGSHGFWNPCNTVTYDRYTSITICMTCAYSGQTNHHHQCYKIHFNCGSSNNSYCPF